MTAKTATPTIVLFPAPNLILPMNPSGSTPRIVIDLGPAGRLEHVLVRGTTTIGRRVENDIRLDDPTVSGRHAQIVWVYDAPYLQDLGSTNGSFVNDQRVAHQELHDGDNIRIGRQVLQFLVVGKATPPPASRARHAPFASDPTPTPRPSGAMRSDTLSFDQVRSLVERARSGGGPPIPAEIHWVAQDATGTWWGFEHRPHPGGSGWREMDMSSFVKLGRGRPNAQWRASLQKV